MQLIWEVTSTDFVFRLAEGAGIDVPVQDWAIRAPASLLSGIALLIGWFEEERVVADEYSVHVPHPLIASLEENQAKQLGLPQAVPFALDIRHHGTLDQLSFRFQYTWVRNDGRQVVGTRCTGALLRAGSRDYRVPEPFFSLVVSMDAFNTNTPPSLEDRFLAWGHLRDILENKSPGQVNTDSYLENVRVARATHFTLDVKGVWNAPDFDPLLLRATVTNATSSGPEESPADPPNLLPPHYQEVFTRRFRERSNTQSRYVLVDGWYVVLEPGLQKALAVARHMQEADAEERRAFTRNPQAYLRDAIGEEQAEALFIETHAFSERVKDIGLWQPKVIPWVKKPSGETWLPPESLGLLVDGKRIEVEPERLAELCEQLQEAIAQGNRDIEWDGQRIPSTPEVLDSVNKLTGETRPTEEPHRSPDRPSGGNERAVLLIQDNLEGTDYRLGHRTTRPGSTLAEPVILRTPFKPHQREGLVWLQSHWRAGSPGALLADDMGLGKTLQALAFLAWIRQGIDEGSIRRRPLLIVAPTGLLKNWEQEHERHLDHPGIGSLIRVYGSNTRELRTETGVELETGRPLLQRGKLQDADWILTTYETLRDYQHSFGAIPFAVAVFDEAQKIKTPGVLMTEAAKAMNADFTLMMTGTPIENRLADFWCLLDTAQPGLLGDLKSFSRRYESNPDTVEIQQLRDALSGNVADSQGVMLRRMKEGHLSGLPEKRETVLKRPMPEHQARAYAEAIQKGRHSDTKGTMLKTLQALRSVSLHPNLPQGENDTDYIAESARLSLTMEILDQIHSQREKALIFLESLDMQAYLAALIQRRYRLSAPPMRINGAVAGPARQQRVNDFQERPDFDVMILSPRAGGVGVTLTAANHVIHLSRWWNPAVEDQCTDRVYRIGQNATVQIYYPLAIHPDFGDHSFDSRLHALLARKRSLSRALLAPPAGSEKDLEKLFADTVRQDTPHPDFTVMDHREFEEWVLQRLRLAGYRVERTPTTGDGGADGIAYPAQPHLRRHVIVQCKHTQIPQRLCDERAVTDLLRAQGRYPIPDAWLAAVTNARGFNQRAIALAQQHHVVLIAIDQLRDWPRCLSQGQDAT